MTMTMLASACPVLAPAAVPATAFEANDKVTMIYGSSSSLEEGFLVDDGSEEAFEEMLQWLGGERARMRALPQFKDAADEADYFETFFGEGHAYESAFAAAPAAVPAAAAEPAAAATTTSAATPVVGRSDGKAERATPTAGGWRASGGEEEQQRALDALLGNVVGGALFWSTPVPAAKRAPAIAIVLAPATATIPTAKPTPTQARKQTAPATMIIAAPVASRTRSKARLAAPIAARTRAKTASTAALRAKACVKCC